MWANDSPQARTAREWGRRWIQFFYTGVPGDNWTPFNEDSQTRAIVGPNGVISFESVKEVFNAKQLQWWHETLLSGGHEAIRIKAWPGDPKAGLGETFDTMP